MCGITGVLGAGRAEDLTEAVRRMLSRLTHRGPDDAGLEVITTAHRTLVLGATRLAILDLSPAGHMPMHDPDTGNWIVYNGEVYNYQTLRHRLESSGMTFRSNTDTEVVLKAYGYWGADCLRHLRGMFAFAIWDARRQELFLARDRLGKKPLYYCTPTPGLFLFASEVRALLQSGLVARRLDPAGLEVFLWNGFLVAPLTLVAGVRSLLPGHCLRVSADGQVDQPVGYWRLPAHPSASDRRDIQEMIRACLEEAVALRLVSDVPLGAFLSGGLDSSTIVALMARASDRVKTFSIVFEEKPYDERAFARWVANRFGTGHTEVEITRQQFCTWLPAALAALDQPTFDGLNTYCVARAAKESGLTVALSGLGGDELFGGYPFFKTGPSLAEMVRLLNILPRTVLRPLATWLTRSPVRLSGPWKLLEATNNLPDIHQVTVRRVCAYQIAQCLFPTWVRRRLYVDSLPVEKVSFGLPHEFLAFLSAELAASEPPQETLSRLALRLFLGERCLRDTDTTSMAVSLEVRAPFTDHSLIETVWAVPAPQRCAGSPNKPFQWTLVKPYLGPDYPVRPKQGFTFPFQEWLHERQVFDIIQTTLGDATLLQEIGLDPSAVQQLMNAFQRSGSALPWSRLWALFVLCYWCAQNRVRL